MIIYLLLIITAVAIVSYSAGSYIGYTQALNDSYKVMNTIQKEMEDYI